MNRKNENSLSCKTTNLICFEVFLYILPEKWKVETLAVKKYVYHKKIYNNS